MHKPILFLDYDGVVNTVIWEHNPVENTWQARYAGPGDGRVNNEQAVQWVSELCKQFDMDIVVTSTWRLSDNYKECLLRGGLREGINIIGAVSTDYHTSRAEQINEWLEANPQVKTRFLILDDDLVDMSPFGYIADLHFIRCTTNGGFQIEEYEEAREKMNTILDKTRSD